MYLLNGDFWRVEQAHTGCGFSPLSRGSVMSWQLARLHLKKRLYKELALRNVILCDVSYRRVCKDIWYSVRI